MSEKKITNIPEKDAGNHSDDRDVPVFEEVEMEDITSEEYPEYFKNDKDSGFPEFSEELLSQAEKLAREKSKMFVDEVFKNSDCQKPTVEQSDDLKNLLRKLKEKEANQPKTEIQGGFYKFHNELFKGKALGWKYLRQLRCVTVKWEKGILYFNRFHDIKTLPFWAVRDICRHTISGATVNNDVVGHFADRMARESRTKWEVFTPQYPRRIVHKKKDQITGLNKVTLNYDPPTVLKH